MPRRSAIRDVRPASATSSSLTGRWSIWLTRSTDSAARPSRWRTPEMTSSSRMEPGYRRRNRSARSPTQPPTTRSTGTGVAEPTRQRAEIISGARRSSGAEFRGRWKGIRVKTDRPSPGRAMTSATGRSLGLVVRRSGRSATPRRSSPDLGYRNARSGYRAGAVKQERVKVGDIEEGPVCRREA